MGLMEILIIGIIALIFLGPKELPVVLGFCVRLIRRFKKYMQYLQEEVDRFVLKAELEKVQESFQETKEDIEKNFNRLSLDVSSASGVSHGLSRGDDFSFNVDVQQKKREKKGDDFPSSENMHLMTGVGGRAVDEEDSFGHPDRASLVTSDDALDKKVLITAPHHKIRGMVPHKCVRRRFYRERKRFLL